MLNLMIVDAEERARTGIKTMIDRSSLGIRFIAEAGDGTEALQLLRNHLVDILLVDIHIPEIEGLTLIEMVKKEFPHIKSVIMSSYNDFLYVKKAISLGACDYLLKPSRQQEITDTIGMVVKEIQEEKRQSEHLERLIQGFRESLPMLKEKTLSKLVLSEDISYEKVRKNLELSEIHFPYDYFVIFVMQLDNLHSLQKSYAPFDIELLKYALKNIGEETVSEPDICVNFEHHDDIIAILNTAVEKREEELLALAQNFQLNAQKYLNLGVSIGIGCSGTQLHNLNLSYMTAVNVLNANYSKGPGKIDTPRDQPDKNSPDWSYPVMKEKAVIHNVMNGDQNSIQESIAAFLAALPSSKDHIINCSLSLFFALYKLHIEKYSDNVDIFGKNLQGIIQTITRENPKTIQNVLLDVAVKVNEHLNARKSRNKLFESILSYIEQNYYKDISRETVANEVFITPGYLSLLFKQQIKTNFLDYLHKIRIDQACILLKDRSKKIGDIALKVGYNDEKYFFQVFKKYIGMTPTQFRNNTEYTAKDGS